MVPHNAINRNRTLVHQHSRGKNKYWTSKNVSNVDFIHTIDKSVWQCLTWPDIEWQLNCEYEWYKNILAPSRQSNNCIHEFEWKKVPLSGYTCLAFVLMYLRRRCSSEKRRLRVRTWKQRDRGTARRWSAWRRRRTWVAATPCCSKSTSPLSTSCVCCCCC